MDFASGKSKSDIARKFNVSVPAISKILNNYKVKNEFDQVKTKLNKEYAKDIITKAYNALYNKSYDELSAETLLKIIERLSLLYNNSFEEEEIITGIDVSFEDASGDGENEDEN